MIIRLRVLNSSPESSELCLSDSISPLLIDEPFGRTRQMPRDAESGGEFGEMTFTKAISNDAATPRSENLRRATLVEHIDRIANSKVGRAGDLTTSHHYKEVSRPTSLKDRWSVPFAWHLGRHWPSWCTGEAEGDPVRVDVGLKCSDCPCDLESRSDRSRRCMHGVRNNHVSPGINANSGPRHNRRRPNGPTPCTVDRRHRSNSAMVN